MNLTSFSLKNPYIVSSLALMVAALGAFAFFRTPTDLFPNTVPPQVAVVTVYPGARASDIADKVTQVLEKEINTAPGVTRVLSTTRDEVSSVMAQFRYDKGIGDAVVDVQNAVARVRGGLPTGVQEPRIYRITDANRPLMTLAITPNRGSIKSLADIRLLAENDIKDRLLAVPGVGDVQVFGAHRPEIEVRVDRHAISARKISLGQILARLATRNVSAPAGTIYGKQNEYLIQVQGEFENAKALEELPITSTTSGQVYLRDVAKVSLTENDPRSFYHGNGKPAIAINVLRPDGGNTVEAIRRVKAYMPKLAGTYPDIHFAVTEDQQPTIDINVQGMRSSLWQAVAMTVLVIFVFLADLRAAAAVSVAIPLSFLTALTILWFSPFTLNMVTLSGLIIAVGMVVDASVVVIENIDRHYAGGKIGAREAALKGTAEVAMPITAGMLTTVVVLVPVAFTKDFTGRIMTPLNLMIISTLVASLIISLTVIPIVSARLLGRTRKKKNVLERLVAPLGGAVDRVAEYYVSLVRWSLRHRLIFMVVIIAFIVFTNRVVKPLIGGEEMPPMDTGIITIDFDTEAGTTPKEVEATLSRVEKQIYKTPGILTSSAMAGSEPGDVSFGSGGTTTQTVHMNVRLVDRTRRDETIWQIEDKWREIIRKTPGVRTLRISEYGATPVSTTKAPFDVIISGQDAEVLNHLGDQVMDRLKGLPGLIDLRRSWYQDKPSYEVSVDPKLARLYGISSSEVAANLRIAIQGVPATQLRLVGFLDIPIRVRYQADQVSDPAQLAELPIPTRLGAVPLNNMATITPKREAPFITREELNNTLDVTAGNRGLTIAQVTGMAKKRLAGVQLPAGYTLQVSGSASDMAEGQREMGKALILGLVLLFILLFAMFKSAFHPLTIMTAIPLAVAGAMWGLLVFDKPFCKPAFMGIILLGGTIVNNAILMLDFIVEAKKKGLPMDEAIADSVRLRLRPILMTATSTIVGFSPLIFEMAVGLERMSPLGIAAGAGLLIGTIVTTVVTPVIFSLLESLRLKVKKSLKLEMVASTAKSVLLFLVVASLLGSTGMVRAETSPLPEPLTLQAAVSYAISHNPDLVIAQAEVKRLEGSVLGSKSSKGLKFDLSSSAAFSSEYLSMIPQAAPTIQRFSDQLYSAGVTARYLLFDFGRTSAEVKTSLARKESGQSLLERRRRETVFEVSRLFLSVLTVRDLLESAEASRKSLASLLVNTEELATAGRAATIDTLKVKVRLAQIKSNIATLRAQQDTLRSALTAALGVEEDVALPKLVYESPQMVGYDNDATDDADLDKRFDVIAASQNLAASDVAVQAVRRSYYPKIEALASYFQYGANDPRSNLPGGPDDNWDDLAIAGVALTLPILDGGLRHSKVQQAMAQQQSAASFLRKQRLAARREIETAISDLTSALVRIAANEQAVSEGNEALRVEKLKYKVGKSTINDVLDAEAAKLTAEGLLREAKRQAEIAGLSLALARGELSVKKAEKATN